MIQASELRIGNWIDVIRVAPVQVTPDHIKAIMSGDTTYYPIPLTPEILEKAGFALTEETAHSWLTVFEGYVHIGYMFKKFPLVLDIDDNRMPLHKIKYVHQLQNLYYSITQEELTINL